MRFSAFTSLRSYSFCGMSFLCFVLFAHCTQKQAPPSPKAKTSSPRTKTASRKAPIPKKRVTKARKSVPSRRLPTKKRSQNRSTPENPRTTYKELERKEKSLLDVLAKIDKERLRLVLLFQKLKEKVVRLSKESKVAKQKWQVQEKICKVLEAKMKPRMRLFYRVVRLGHARILLDTRTLQKMAQRWRGLQRIVEGELEMLKKYHKIRLVAKKAFVTWEKKHQALRKAIKETEQKEKDLLRNHQKKEKALDGIFKQKKLYQQALKEVKDSSQQLNKSVFKEWTQSGLSKGLKKLKGKLFWPIPNYSPYCSEYTIKKSGSFVALICLKVSKAMQRLRGPFGRSGITLVVPEGTPVQAVASGRVVYSGWQRGYGQVLIVLHGQGFYSLYAHLSKFLVLKENLVRTGQVIGVSGSSGSLGDPALYFELKHFIRSLPPEDWLLPAKKPTQ